MLNAAFNMAAVAAPCERHARPWLRRKRLQATLSGLGVTSGKGFRAFIPEALPPEPPTQLSGRLQSLLSIADRALGRLDESIHTLPHPDLFVAMYVRKEAVLSSQIEGTQRALQERSWPALAGLISSFPR